MGAGTSPAEREFFLFGKPPDLSATLQGPIFTKLGHETYFDVPSRNPKDILENVHFRGHLPPKSEIESRSNRYLIQSRLQVTGCTAERYCLLHVVVQGPRSFRDRSTFLYDVRLRSYGASNDQSCPIFGLWPIFAIRNP